MSKLADGAMGRTTVETLKHLYLPKPGISIVDVPAMNFLMIDGRGRPGGNGEFQEAMEVLYGICYTLKFMRPKGDAIRELKVMPPEGLWGRDDTKFDPACEEDWVWTLMIMQPAPIDACHVRDACEELRQKKNPGALSRVRFERFAEGLAVQALHVGPYAAESSTIENMYHYAEGQGYKFRGRHHEVYISDPRRTKPERLKTVLRHPIVKA
ncbi:MAG: GyrI-like domain-containing protein [candidate division WOR-3 bacterium]